MILLTLSTSSIFHVTDLAGLNTYSFPLYMYIYIHTSSSCSSKIFKQSLFIYNSSINLYTFKLTLFHSRSNFARVKLIHVYLYQIYHELITIIWSSHRVMYQMYRRTRVLRYIKRARFGKRGWSNVSIEESGEKSNVSSD